MEKTSQLRETFTLR